MIIELKTQPDRDMVFQAVDYWRKIELQRRRGVLAAADLFDGARDHRQTGARFTSPPRRGAFIAISNFLHARISPEIELWRFELHEDWRKAGQRVLAGEDIRRY